MKKLCLLIAALFVLSCISCQSESAVEDTSGALGPNSQLTAVLYDIAATAHDPGYVIDSTHCFNIKLPFTVKINGEELHLASENDYAIAENLLPDNAVAVNTLEYVFPVTVEYTLGGSQVRVNSMADYNALRQSCESNVNYLSPDCFSVNYPLTVLGYNSSFQVQRTYVLTDNEGLYNFLSILGAGEYYAINYPVTVYVGGQPLTVVNNTQLQQAITSARGICTQ